MQNSRFFSKIALYAGFLFMTACTSSLKITRVNDTPLSDNHPTREIKFFKAGESSPPAYEILGKVYAYKRGGTIFSKPSDNSLIKMMREPAVRMGADAVIDFRSSIFNGKEYNSIRRWASGLAVKLNDLTASPEGMQSDLLVVMAPPRFEKEQNAKNEAKFTKAMQEAAQYQLEQKGYYAILTKEALSPLTLGLIDSMDAETLRQYGDSRAGLILLFSLEKVSSGHMVIAGAGDAQMSAKLISKKTRKIVWENAGTGSTFTLGAIFTLFEDRKKKAIYAGVKDVFESLPTIAESYGVENDSSSNVEQ